MEFPADVLTLLFSDMRFREHVLNFRLACRRWNNVSHRASAKRLRQLKHAYTCGGPKSGQVCSRIGEITCQVCCQYSSCPQCMMKCSVCMRWSASCCNSTARVSHGSICNICLVEMMEAKQRHVTYLVQKYKTLKV